ncbi:HAD family hydrolase [Streptomyces solicathayae]|uniref:HAD family hydrolase n=1 Tax=Streptomyces solicathayae TaxID=3081768 RepID=A0ABZ0LLM8_9ACTN|nr:HAD family hydrolase [Streptomyces sp. HUAS YS2]WOX20402.1 HAD family hydrolase [Streptomyces sp. HUAS YS2]
MTPRNDERLQGAALFDLDGTLVDTNYLHVLAWWQALLQYGHEVPMARIHGAIGMGADRLLDKVLGDDRDKRQDESVADAHGTLYATWYKDIRPFDSAADLLRAVAARGWTVVLASSASEAEASAVRRRLDAEDVIAAATSGGDVDSTKPAPDLVERALDTVAADPERAVLVGDTVWDVEAAARAGVPCVALLTGGVSKEALENSGAVAVYDDAATLLRHIDTSPLSRPPS